MGMLSSNPRPQLRCGPGRTKQAMKAECDINNILKRYAKSGLLTHLAKGVPSFMDVSEVGDYRTALEHLRSTEAFFAGLPSKVRAAFNNDPAQFLDAVDTVEGRAKLEEIGVIPKKEEAPVPEGEGAPAQ